ncbi:Hypothetical protein NTJ_11543 [Nesidiocoris tenuis]|uniref:Cathepsin propeptide inhibitor domain-containing protein n=1 Tax=Nesidiocoris tenuis TaxID=355587 RepID=A0ABN7B2T7_9HEMI|nr:Hypothetical protein NTJ_11543 [Nesidiocoris tenuis]
MVFGCAIKDTIDLTMKDGLETTIARGRDHDRRVWSGHERKARPRKQLDTNWSLHERNICQHMEDTYGRDMKDAFGNAMKDKFGQDMND